MTSKLFGILVMVVGFAAGCGTTPSLRANRGTVTFNAALGGRAIVTGPAEVRAYEGFAGGELYEAPASTGSDADCAGGAGGAVVPVPRDKVARLAVPADRIVCVRARDGRGHHLIWRAVFRPATNAPAGVTALLEKGR